MMRQDNGRSDMAQGEEVEALVKDVAHEPPGVRYTCGAADHWSPVSPEPRASTSDGV